ncbi:MAG: hypothetical protein AVDCRST_MAG09-2046 [uncultured Sphingomonas sp.]|uniref:Uncharacterized protein n=1 Tax=uncultured Sphingomonas sp. TaxID=158754 RepID=A0A6J4TF21_9SPHN|nr:MAG: hypothetical protein AVDCRST_MAG09-2046 [uncultured Sphingomonas sp.]
MYSPTRTSAASTVRLVSLANCSSCFHASDLLPLRKLGGSKREGMEAKPREALTLG